MLARTFLRLCALEAVRPSSLLATDGPWPTMAAAHVFDSRLDPIDDLTEKERRPVIAIYTEDDHQEKIAQAGPIFYKSTTDLTFEIAVFTLGEDDAGGGFVAGVPHTDAEAEASLDALENQIWHALHFGPSGALFRKIAKGPALHWQSHAMRGSQEAVRYAARTVRAKYDVREICYQAVPDAPPTGLDRLPPALKMIAAALDGSTYLAQVIAGVAGAAPVMPTRVNLESVAATIDPRTASTPADADVEIETKIDNLQG